MIEKWHSPLQAHAHRHLVHAHQQELGQPEVEIDVRHPIHMRRLGRPRLESSSYRLNGLPRRETAERATETRRQQPPLLGISKRFGAAPEQRLAAGAAPQPLEMHGPVVTEGGERGAAGPLDRAWHRPVVPALSLERLHPARIADEQLVCAFTDLTHDHAVFPRQPGHVVQRYADRVGNRLVL